MKVCSICIIADQAGWEVPGVCVRGWWRMQCWDRGEEQLRATELSSSKRAPGLEPGIIHTGFSHFAVAGYPVTVVKVQEQIKVK